MIKFVIKKILFRMTSLCLAALFLNPAWAADPMDEINKAYGGSEPVERGEDYQEYIDFFDEVYNVISENYYVVPDRTKYKRFLKVFDKQIYSKLKTTGKSENYIKWRSAAHMIDFIKSDEDIFSAFFPPKPAKEYETKVLGKKIDIGIKGVLIDIGFVVEQVEPRSDSYVKGLRKSDLIKSINGIEVSTLTQEDVEELLVPDAGAVVKIAYLDAETRTPNVIEVESAEYFKQTVFMVPLKVPDVYLLELQKFNRKTSDDLFRYLKLIKSESEDPSLILDLRGNPGGPPLAAREISSFFLEPNQEFAYFQKRDRPKSSLDVPEIPVEFRFSGPIVILVDGKSGSASELFSGVMQNKERAIIMGQNTAGQVLLKSMFHFDDESMVLLVTGRGHYPDGSVFKFTGVEPDRKVNEDGEDDLVKHAVNYLIYLKKTKN